MTQTKRDQSRTRLAKASAKPQLSSSQESFRALDPRRDLLRFITCGSVDDGKSTLIGRLLWEGQYIHEDLRAAFERDSQRFGTQGQNLDFSLLVDGLSAEREQHITIDVAYRFFATAHRNFIVADTPGHEQYTRNMVSGASTSSLAVLLVDVKQGITTQTRRHAYAATLVGIRHFVLAVNKMDLADYSQAPFSEIEQQFEKFCESLHVASAVAIPLSALHGDNIFVRSAHMSWYAGPTLMGYLDTVETKAGQSGRLAFPVQWVNRPNAEFRGFSGTVAQGEVRVGDLIRVTRSGECAAIRSIVTMDGDLLDAREGDAVTLTLDREVDISRGDVISASDEPFECTDQFEATLIWTGDEGGLVGRSYDLKLATQWSAATITSIKYGIGLDTLGHEARKSLSPNDICVCNIATTRSLACAPFEQIPVLGRFILVDRFTSTTVAVGVVTHSLRRAQNVHTQALTVDRPMRERLNGHKGKIVWFTGLSGSGKSTIANALEVALYARGQRTYLLDGDNLRQGLNKDLGFTDADRVENVRRVIEVARLMMDAGLVVIAALISPFRREREMAAERLGRDNFVEVYVSTDLATCERRDVKGLYKRARAGQLPNFSGISSAYEPPESPDVVLDGESTDPAASAAILLDYIESMSCKGR